MIGMGGRGEEGIDTLRSPPSQRVVARFRAFCALAVGAGKRIQLCVRYRFVFFISPIYVNINVYIYTVYMYVVTARWLYTSRSIG